VNEEPALESSLDLTLTQHPYDEDPELRKVRVRLEVDPPQAWYYCIFSNFCTLMILLQIDLAFGDELKTISEGCNEIEDTSSHALQLSMLDIIVGCMVQFANCLLIAR
jgi:hypothetical protein